MSEYINNNQIRKEKLFALAFAIMVEDSDRKMIDEYWDFIKEVRPYDVLFIVDKLMKTGQDIGQIKKTTAKIINLFYEPLQEIAKTNKQENSLFLQLLTKENRQVEQTIELLKDLVKSLSKKSKKEEDISSLKVEILQNVILLKEYEKHYQKKENILFPYIEKQHEHYRCVSVMWSMHDDYRESLKELEIMLSSTEMNLKDFHSEIGRLFFAVKPTIFREEFILFPVAMDLIPQDQWVELLKEAFEIGFSYIEVDSSILKTQVKKKQEVLEESDGKHDLETGSLTVEQIVLLFNHLPVDITYVDENDRVQFFSQPKDRFFTRSKSIIGRTVQNCHPHESVYMVEKIVDAFRKGEKDDASFWIQMKGKFILIKYFAIRDKKGTFRGTLEVSQDITDIRKLDGERRLLDWE